MKKLLLLAVLAACWSLVASPAFAGNIYLTGHDLDFHCAIQPPPTQCNAYMLAVEFARAGAPDPTKPVLLLDQGTETQTAWANAGLPAGEFVVVDPTSAGFASLSLSTSDYSAIVIASDFTCGGCDNTLAGETAIDARTADIQSFFNAGGGLVYLAGALDSATYYASVPVGATGTVTCGFGCYTLTPAGITFGLTNDDANCCATHNSFLSPASALTILETDNLSGNAETLVGGSLTIGGGGFGGGVPEPSSMVLLGTGFTLFAGLRKRFLRK